MTACYSFEAKSVKLSGVELNYQSATIKPEATAGLFSKLKLIERGPILAVDWSGATGSEALAGAKLPNGFGEEMEKAAAKEANESASVKRKSLEKEDD